MAESFGQQPMGEIRSGKAAASVGINMPSLASTTGAKYPAPKIGELSDKERAHPGRGGVSTPSDPGDCDHGHCWGS